MRVTIPVGVTATLLAPLRGMRSPRLLDQTAKARPLFAQGAPTKHAAATVRKITRVRDAELGEALAVELGSGTYDVALVEDGVA